MACLSQLDSVASAYRLRRRRWRLWLAAAACSRPIQ